MGEPEGTSLRKFLSFPFSDERGRHFFLAGQRMETPQAASRGKENAFWDLAGWSEHGNVTLEAEQRATPCPLTEHSVALWMRLRTVTAGNR